MSANLVVHMFPCLNDNYGFLLHAPDSGLTASIDTPDANAIAAELAARGWTLSHVFNTHHHGDHAGGNLALKAATGCTIVGNGADAARIPGIDVHLRDGDVFDFGGHAVEVMETPGHTVGHMVYHVPGQRIAFVGDTLFAMGCGRMFEGSPAQMWNSLRRLRAWPEDTVVYCAHEYTLANGRFALSVDADNAALQRRMAEVRQKRDAGLPTVPTQIGVERDTNPFLRADDAGFAAGLGMAGRPPEDVFAETRRRKDHF